MIKGTPTILTLWDFHIKGTLFPVGYLEKDKDNQDIWKITQYQKIGGLFTPIEYFFTEARYLEKKFMVKKLLKNLFCSCWDCDV